MALGRAPLVLREVRAVGGDACVRPCYKLPAHKLTSFGSNFPGSCTVMLISAVDGLSLPPAARISHFLCHLPQGSQIIISLSAWWPLPFRGHDFSQPPCRKLTNYWRSRTYDSRISISGETNIETLLRHVKLQCDYWLLRYVVPWHVASLCSKHNKPNLDTRRGNSQSSWGVRSVMEMACRDESIQTMSNEFCWSCRVCAICKQWCLQLPLLRFFLTACRNETYVFLPLAVRKPTLIVCLTACRCLPFRGRDFG